MAVYKNTVNYYTKGTAEIEVFFPEDQVKCQWCEFLKNEYFANRTSCRLTGEMLPYILDGIGNYCPLKFEEEIKE